MSDVSTAEATEHDDADTGGEAAGGGTRTPLTSEEYERRLQNLGRDAKEQRRQIRELTQRLETAGATPQTKAEREAEPDLDGDPIAWMKYAQKRLNFYEQREAEQDRSQKENQAANERVAKIARSFADAERDFAEDHPDYTKAAAHFRKARTEELTEEGVSAADMGRALQQDFINIIARATGTGKDPAEIIYNLAKRRGFGGDGDDKKLQTIDRATKAGRTLSGTGGGTGGGELTIEYVNSLKGKAFTEARAKFRDQQRAAERQAARG